jgi:hypothetical protein
MTHASPPLPLGRRAELAGLVLLLVAAVAHVVASSGGPTWPRLVALGAAGLCACVAALAGGARWLDGWRLPLVLLLLTQVPQVQPTLHRPDGFEYYVLARSVLFDRDFDLDNDFPCLRTFGQFRSDGKAVTRTPCGTAILWTPAVVLTHLGTLVARGLGATVPADGCSAPYLAAATLASFFLGAITAFLAEGVVRRRHGPALGLLVAFGLWAATPLAYYSVRVPSASHAGSAFMVGAFTVLWLRYRDSPDPRRWLLLGAVGGLMAIVRVQDGVLLATPALDLLLAHRAGWLRRVVALCVGPAIAWLVQALVWARLWGPDFLGHITDRNEFIADFHVMEVLLSPRHGLFTWTPLFFLAVVGWLILLWLDLRLGAAILAGFSLLLLVNSGFADWSGSIAFGQRRFLGLSVLFGLGLGQLFEALRRRPLIGVATLVAGLALWNQQFTEIFVERRVARRDHPHTLDRLAPAQVEVFYRGWLAAERRLPRWLFVAGYDNLKGVWLDEGISLEGRVDLTFPDEDQPLPFLIGEGWLSPSERGSVGFRRSRGFSSSIRVPIYTPGSFRLTVKARSVLPDRDVGVSLAVNGATVGKARAAREWGELRYEIPRSTVLSGFNTLVFSYDSTRRDVHPDLQGLNAAVAVQQLIFERRPP